MTCEKEFFKIKKFKLLMIQLYVVKANSMLVLKNLYIF